MNLSSIIKQGSIALAFGGALATLGSVKSASNENKPCYDIPGVQRERVAQQVFDQLIANTSGKRKTVNGISHAMSCNIKKETKVSFYKSIRGHTIPHHHDSYVKECTYTLDGKIAGEEKSNANFRSLFVVQKYVPAMERRMFVSFEISDKNGFRSQYHIAHMSNPDSSMYTNKVVLAEQFSDREKNIQGLASYARRFIQNAKNIFASDALQSYSNIVIESSLANIGTDGRFLRNLKKYVEGRPYNSELSCDILQPYLALLATVSNTIPSAPAQAIPSNLQKQMLSPLNFRP